MSDTIRRVAAQVRPAVPRHFIDEASLPDWGTAADGRKVRLIHDSALQHAYAQWQSESCAHEDQMTGKTVNAGGVDCYKRYCRLCGIATTQQLPYRTVEATVITLVDDARRQKTVDKYVRYRREALDGIANAAAERAQPGRRSEYAEYLNSAAWAGRRRAVLDRCDGICEGCRNETAAHVHHMTYRHVGDEFLFELVGLCVACHARIHSEEA